MGLEHPWGLVTATSPGTKSPRIPRDIIMQYVVLEKTLDSSLEIQPVHSEGDGFLWKE